MGLFGNIFGGNGENDRIANKALVKKVKTLEKALEKAQNDYSDLEHANYRSHEIEIREMREDFSDDINRMERENDRKIEGAASENKKALEVKGVEIAKLKSEIQDLKLALEESVLDVDLQIKEGVLDYKTEHLKEVTDLEVKLAVSQGETKTAQAESNSKDAIIKVLTDMVEARGGDVTEALELVSDIAPNLDLSNLSFNVSAPASQKQGGDQKKKDN